MNSYIFSGVLLLCLVFQCYAGPKRVIDPELSKEDHYADGADHEHNPEYDHEAFVGKDQARQFEELTPEQSKERLGKLFHKVDKSGDGKVTEEELKEWIKFTQKRYVWEDAEKQMKHSDQNKDGEVSWEEYKNTTYGFMEDEESSDGASSYKDMVNRDKRRFDKADKDKKSSLNAEQFTAFLHPESDDDMKGIVIEETMEDIDKDKDGKISLDEYIGDLWPEEERAKGEEPDWVKTEREQFEQYRDTNKDGFMDKAETGQWIMPDDFDHVSSEAKHLISESDVDNDGQVTKEEMVDKYDLYVGSQATDFGEALKKHEEL